MMLNENETSLEHVFDTSSQRHQTFHKTFILSYQDFLGLLFSLWSNIKSDGYYSQGPKRPGPDSVSLYILVCGGVQQRCLRQMDFK